ncbi:FAD/NAD(P)-binding protein [Flagellimonas crocea]|uniref:FAD/NAD(P)-binding protein n=1 Tax=Flagellimonas crocea TaxID=3067311 RepID=UPI00296EB590|nr:FAD/NAD(P)-binding protein [Muricauda sp. DH64]
MSAFKIAIVGLGPKGLFAFERLLSNLYNSDLAQEAEIHLFEKTGDFGAGSIYDPHQPGYLLMNYPNRNINVWDKEHPAELPVDALSFSEWLSKRNDCSVQDVGDGFAPRALVGAYLLECFEKLYDLGSSFCKIIKHKAIVFDVLSMEESTCLLYRNPKSGNHFRLHVDELLITTGHCSWKGKLERNRESNEHTEDKATRIPFVYPLTNTMEAVSEKDIVGIKGMGLTFIDTVLALTEGRGGYFSTGDNGALMYHPSKKEPKQIVAFSRSGLPMIPRLSYEGKQEYKPVYFTSDNVLCHPNGNGKPSFEEDILPLFKLETTYRYYKVQFEKYGLTLPPEKATESLQKQIEIFHNSFPEEPRFHFENLFSPVDFGDPSTKLDSLAYFKYVLGQAELGSEKSPFMAAAMTWGQIAETFNSIYGFGGMTPDSHLQFDQEYRSILNRISYGPPLENMRKLIALIDSGILNVSYSANPEINTVENGWTLRVPKMPLITVNTMIDARIPSNNSCKDWSELLVRMRQRGELREFLIENKSTIYRTACPEINRNGNVVKQHGEINPRITLYGTLTEGITYDNDSLSRSRNNMASAWARRIVERHNKLEVKA